MQLSDMLDKVGVQRHHRAITNPGGLPVKGPADAQSDGMVIVERPPGCAFFISTCLWMPKQFHQRIVESDGRGRSLVPNIT
ncbi:hypothetical protein A9P93_00210 [Klebsiella pneumoniae]|nr:hypothetical protein A9P93_00210 [Klebsiella pneumoniae]GKN58694.1 hypothetical protein NUBL17188_39020 [Klebsiella pneumoniae]